MNVPYLLTTVPKTKDAATLLDRFFAVVIVDILGMGRFAQVKNYNLNIQISIHLVLSKS
jgi:hypothetical protein